MADQTLAQNLDPNVFFEVINGVANLGFVGGKVNSLSTKLVAQFIEKLDFLQKDNSIKILRIFSINTRNSTFSAGADLYELANVRSYEDAIMIFGGIAKLILKLKNLPQLVICEVNGAVVGGGVGLISACDYVIASNNIKCRLPEILNGIGPMIIAPPVIRKIGLAAFTAMTIDAEWRDSEWCKTHALVSMIVKENEINNKSQAICDEVAKCSYANIMNIKQMLWEGTDWSKVLMDRAIVVSKMLVASNYASTSK